MKCPTQRDKQRGIPGCKTSLAKEHCAGYLRREIEDVDPRGVVTLGSRATEQTLEAFGVASDSIRVTEDYGRSIDADYPIVISLHWASRTVKQREWVHKVQEGIAAMFGESAATQIELSVVESR